MQTVTIDEYRIDITEKEDVDLDHLLWTYYKCQQVHSADIYLREDGQKFIQQQADAIITNVKNKKIAVRVADCLPIVLMWKKYFAVVHAGWKWLYWWIVSKAIEVLHTKSEKQLKMFVWPSIGPCCYEVWPEFKDYFDAKYLSVKWWMVYLDMIAVVKDIAITHWIKNNDITISLDCTCCSGKYFSYRRGDKNQRMIIAVEKIS